MTGRRGVLWLLAFALVAAQALGLMHRVVHGPQSQLAHEFAAQQPAHADDGADARDGHDHGHGWLASLFANHDDESTCRLFDSLSHDGTPGVPAAALPVVLTSFFLQWAQGEALVRWAALFDARGPPPVR